MSNKKKVILIIHGGAGARRPKSLEVNQFDLSIQRILDQIYPLMVKGLSAVSAVVRAVELLENDPLYNAGIGSKIQSDGKIRMSAALMDGHRLRFSGCVNVQKIRNPIRLCEKLQSEDDRVLSDSGALKRAKEFGLEMRSALTPTRKKEYLKKKLGKTGTVGAVAMDSKGLLAAATSTGGRGYEYPYRVSDTPTIAANFANDQCAVSCTGVGEKIVELGVAVRLVNEVSLGLSLEQSAKKIMSQALRNKALVGFIALDFRGNLSIKTSSNYLIYGVRKSTV